MLFQRYLTYKLQEMHLEFKTVAKYKQMGNGHLKTKI